MNLWFDSLLAKLDMIWNIYPLIGFDLWLKVVAIHMDLILLCCTYIHVKYIIIIVHNLIITCITRYGHFTIHAPSFISNATVELACCILGDGSTSFDLWAPHVHCHKVAIIFTTQITTFELGFLLWGCRMLFFKEEQQLVSQVFLQLVDSPFHKTHLQHLPSCQPESGKIGLLR